MRQYRSKCLAALALAVSICTGTALAQEAPVRIGLIDDV